VTADTSILSYFFSASSVVKFVMFILLSASIMSWVIIFQQGLYLRWAKRHLDKFEERFWKSTDLTQLYNELANKEDMQGLELIFLSGFREFAKLCKKPGVGADAVLAGAQRAMRVAHMHVMDELEMNLPFLATVGSTSPYVGLFGTVWGIMTAFQALGHVEQATISMVAPGISEALVATAMGLFAAIPAVIAYNRYMNTVERLLNRYDAFEEEFSSFLYRQVHSERAAALGEKSL
jgi:biopolymer transport protein TolQ